MADQRIQYTEETVGANHATKTDVLNRLILIEHNNDGTHKNIPLLTNAESVLSAQFVVTGSAGTYQDTGLSILLPAAGTYLLYGNISSQIDMTVGTFAYIETKLYNSTLVADVANSERQGAYTYGTSLGYVLESSSQSQVVSVTAANTIKLYAKRDGTYTTLVQSTVDSSSQGRTILGYVRIG